VVAASLQDCNRAIAAENGLALSGSDEVISYKMTDDLQLQPHDGPEQGPAHVVFQQKPAAFSSRSAT
jgi:hypothetical protein